MEARTFCHKVLPLHEMSIYLFEIKLGLIACIFFKPEFNYIWVSLGAQRVKNPPATAGDPGLILRLGRSPGEGNDYPLQYSGLENSMDCKVHGVAKSRT